MSWLSRGPRNSYGIICLTSVIPSNILVFVLPAWGAHVLCVTFETNVFILPLLHLGFLITLFNLTIKTGWRLSLTFYPIDTYIYTKNKEILINSEMGDYPYDITWLFAYSCQRLFWKTFSGVSGEADIISWEHVHVGRPWCHRKELGGVWIVLWIPLTFPVRGVKIRCEWTGS